MNKFSLLLYTAEDSDIKVNAILKNETIWLSQKRMEGLFDVEVPAISKHLTNILRKVNYRKLQLFSKWK